MNVATAVEEAALNADFFDEKGLLKEYQLKQMNVLLARSTDKPIMIEFGCGLTALSFDRKLILQADTGADANAINKNTFDELFPEVELEESIFLLQNFEKQLVKPIGPFRCFLRWRDHKYRVKSRNATLLRRYQSNRLIHSLITFQFLFQIQQIDFHPWK